MPMSALPPKADMCSAQAHVRFVPIADIGYKLVLLDYSITSSARAISAEGTSRPIAFAGGKIDQQFERGRLLDREMSRFRTLEYPVELVCGNSIHLAPIWAIGHQAPCTNKFGPHVQSWQAALVRQI